MDTVTAAVAVDVNVIVVSHPLVQNELARLRHRNTDLVQFAHGANQIARMLAFAATADLWVVQDMVPTPLCPAQVQRLDKEQRKIAVPVLRAGLGIEWGFREMVPDARSFHLGLVRDEITAEASVYMSKLGPCKLLATDAVFLLDPMLATGGSALNALRMIVAAGASVENIKIICVVAAPEGIATVRKEFPTLKIYTAAVDECLDERKFIVPGLGDFGDRLYGTC